MIHTRPSRRLGAACLVGIAGAVVIAAAQRPWRLGELSPGPRARVQKAAAAMLSAASDKSVSRYVALRPEAFGSAPSELRDAVAGGAALTMSGAGPAPIIDAVPKASGVVIGAGTAVAPAEKAGGALSAMPKGGGRGGKQGKVKAGEPDVPGGPEARHKGKKGEADDRGERSSGAKTRGAAAKGVSGAAAGRAAPTRAKSSARTAKSSLQVSGAAASESSDSGAGGRRRSARNSAGAASGGAGAGRVERAGAGPGGRRGRGSSSRGGGGESEASEGGDPFSHGNSKVRLGAASGGNRGGGRKGGGRKGGGRAGGGGGAGAGGDDDEAGGAPAKGGKKGGKGGGRGGGKGGGKGGKAPGKEPSGDARFHPILHKSLGGETVPRPPAKDLPSPDFSGLGKSIPAKGPDGAPISPEPAGYKDIESARPPKLPAGDGAGSFQWQKIGGVAYYCSGAVCGRWSDSHWLWMQNQDGKWWVQSFSPRPDGTMGSDSPAFTSHQGHWWWQDSKGPWYVVHEAEPWSYRYLRRYKQEGLVHPESGVHMVHTPDGRVMVVTPGKGAVVYDGKTGKELERVREEDLPKQRPPDVSLPFN
ncbi:MAG: hypothetical protein HY077_01135 [Elusimicrobia bacterium]|nr:hypothetical protein [Elusimicrobiota bacterium]